MSWEAASTEVIDYPTKDINPDDVHF